MQFTFTQILDIIGTLAFAISGIRLSSAKRFDLFGAYIVGLVTAIGGGTARDIMLNNEIFWMHDPIYLILTGIALIWVMIFGKQLIHQNSTWFLFDTIGLAMFTVTGIEKTLSAPDDYPFWVAIIMGALTGAAGGVFRDVFMNQVPLIFRGEIYAMACIAGGVFYWVLSAFGCNHVTCGIACAVLVIVLRLVAVMFKLHLPFLKGEDN
ncbi:MAG: trimeric intracellular cation channel family protein [Bacteroidales bacterium]|nr:trimeric intracellular cation channel family protein [Candidatus Equimonas faecalis]